MNDIDQLMAFDSEVGAAVGKELKDSATTSNLLLPKT